SFAVRVLSQVTEQSEPLLEPLLSALQRAQIAIPRLAPELEYIFNHAAMQQAAYNTLLVRRRQALHATVARAIVALYPADEYIEIIAYHFGQTQEHAEAATWLERAGDHAAASFANA